MSAVLTPPEDVATTDRAAEKRFVLPNVSWETYEQILKNYENSSAPRFTYDRGELEIMSPLPPHETVSRAFELLVNEICDGKSLDVESLGSTTFKREEWDKGTEPDGCFYIQSVDKLAGQDLSEIEITDYPPDLVIEVDYTSPSIDKFPIYAALGVPEIWHYQNKQVRFFQLRKKRYVEIKESIVLPEIKSEDVTRFVNNTRTMKRSTWLKSIRRWVRSL